MKNEQKFFVSFFQKRKTFLGASDRHQAGHLWARARPPARRIISDRLVFVETLRLPPFAARYAQPQVPTASRPAGAPTSTGAPRRHPHPSGSAKHIQQLSGRMLQSV